MDYGIQTGSLEKRHTDCLVVGVYAKNKLTDTAKQLDEASDGKISTVLKMADLESAGSTLLLHDISGIKAARVLLVGLGSRKSYDLSAYKKAVTAAIALTQKDRSHNLLLTLATESCQKTELDERAREAVMIAEALDYRFDACKSEEKRKKDAPKHPLKKLQLWLPDRKEVNNTETGLKQGQAIANGMKLAKDLANLPGNICTPTHLAETAVEIGKTHKNLKVDVLEEKEMEKLGMGSLLSVSRGSRQPAKLIVMEYNGGKKGDKPVALVGKGLTFDAGGISIKPAAGMDEMKYDMCGGASVIGSLQACAELALPINVVGLVPASENLPDGNANKPGDIVTSMSGQTIEVLNTDAEGRLILCDTLTYTERFEPSAVIDIATLTGACIIALGHHASGLMANDQDLANELLAAGQEIDDRAWQLPIWDDYQKQLDSPFADIGNIGGRAAGTITAACFLSRFTKKFKWAHLDIAGTAWNSGKDKGATGRPVPLLMQFLLKRSTD